MKLIAGVSAAVLALLVLMQFVPYGKNHENPPVAGEPAWDTPRTRELFFAACKDCHSNETTWPWYASIAPVSWLVYHDVEEGRSEFNVSRWGQGKQEADEAAKMVRKGKMPPRYYLPAHPEARLGDTDERDLIRGLVATFGEEEDDD
ncbi:MAG: heme-binding domain-containing protein [Deltaproteobacteria bacterium]|jgi:mono/diheme cytochrome c family protein|nr:heme-binding domain-containing protein [Deltaproteobacteria bacterium]MBW2540960.1 heme-binding domain-containing protein [Deltaproteobacteria bacterium]